MKVVLTQTSTWSLAYLIASLKAFWGSLIMNLVKAMPRECLINDSKIILMNNSLLLVFCMFFIYKDCKDMMVYVAKHNNLIVEPRP